jgi:hydroxymethylbilane synthase
MLTIGSRGSALALWQARWVANRLAELGEETRIEVIQTTGDRLRDVALSKVGTKGMFTLEIEEALRVGVIDLAVHSLKDMPTELPSGLVLAAIPERENPCDALVGGALFELAQGARVGTSSLRRAAQLRHLRPDLQILDIRGNVDTRLRKLDAKDYDAIVLAAAGLTRLGWRGRIAEVLSPDLMCPAAGQGALAIEAPTEGRFSTALRQKLDHPETCAAVTAERTLLASLGGGCQVPVGAYAELRAGAIHLRSVVISPDGASLVSHSASGTDPVLLGQDVGEHLLAHGAKGILELVYHS